MVIHTPRLELVPASAELMRLEMDGHAELSRRLNADIPDTWPPENIRDVLEMFAQELEARGEPDGWGAWYWLSNAETLSKRILVGSGGFRGLPDAQGRAEIGYGTLEIFHGRGYATEAVAGLVTWAFARPETQCVFAEASPDNPASVRVLEKTGFTLVGAGSEADVSLFEKRHD